MKAVARSVWRWLALLLCLVAPLVMAGGRRAELASGLVMLALGAMMILRPEWLARGPRR